MNANSISKQLKRIMQNWLLILFLQLFYEFVKLFWAHTEYSRNNKIYKIHVKWSSTSRCCQIHANDNKKRCTQHRFTALNVYLFKFAWKCLGKKWEKIIKNSSKLKILWSTLDKSLLFWCSNGIHFFRFDLTLETVF